MVATVSVSAVPVRFWPAPLTVVFAFPDDASKSTEPAFTVALSSSMLAPSPSSVVSMPNSSVPSSVDAAMKLTVPVPTSTVKPESTLIDSVLMVSVELGTR